MYNPNSSSEFEMNNLSPYQIEILKILADPLRYKIYNLLSKPMTVSDVAESLGFDRKILYYHFKKLLGVKLIEQVDSRKVKNLSEAVYLKNEDVKHFVSADDDHEYMDNAIANVMQSMVDDFLKALLENDKCIASASRRSIKISKSRIREFGREFIAIRKTLWENLEAFADGSEDCIEIEFLISFFEKPS